MTQRKISSDTAWMSWASCTEVDPDSFFSEGIGRGLSIENVQALKVCGGCAVRGECLDYAMSFPAGQAAVGIWGGTTSSQRYRLLHPKRYAA